jgi:hypothetical protein
MVPVSNDTLLRVVRRPAVRVSNRHWSSGSTSEHSGQRYGTIICDLEHRKTIAGHRRWRNGQITPSMTLTRTGGSNPVTGYSPGVGIQASCAEQNVPHDRSSCRDVPHRRVMNAVPSWVIQHSDAPMMSARGCVPRQRRQAARLRISPGTNYNPRYARNKRVQASVYFSWPLAAKW